MKILKLISINFLILLISIIIFELIFGNWLKKNNFGYTARELRNIEIPMSVKYEGENYTDYPGGNEGYSFNYEHDYVEGLIKDTVEKTVRSIKES